MNLIIVESPTKARTFNRILKGRDYYVFATMGHIRDLPTNKISIDYDNNFKPGYQIMKNKIKIVAQLKELAKKYTNIILATDLDREGESIAYHAAYLIGKITEKWPNFKTKTNDGLKRIVFHEITEHALNEALDNPSILRTDLIKAQQARRILDRIVGYELSPLLWKKTGKNWLSAGRVQTVALRLIVEREKEIRNFKKEIYYQIDGLFTPEIKAKLVKKDGKDYESIYALTLFAGEYKYTKTSISKDNVPHITDDLKSDTFKVSDVKESVIKRYPPPPLTTSLLQQEAFYRYGFTSKMSMKLAQDLYERGLITYHRTDSFNMSTKFVFQAKDYIIEKYGKNYSLDKPRGYRTKSRSAQEAHEAIRPTKLTVSAQKITKLTINHKRLYQLIFDRAVCTQMKEAEIKQIKISIISGKNYEFIAEKQQVIFDGFLKLLNPTFVSNHQSSLSLKIQEKLDLKSCEPQENETKPPPRYNEASLIKIMEEKGIGRPSTYAPIISLIQTKGYTEKDGRYFIPTSLGEAICDYLSSSFPTVFDLNFTSDMETGLDQIANGEKDMIELLALFYSPFKTLLEEKKDDTRVITIKDDINEKCPKCAKSLTLRYSKYGKFYACTGYPACRYIKPFLKIVKNRKCPKCFGDVVIKYSRSKKRFYGCSNYPKCDWSSWSLVFIKSKTNDKIQKFR